MSDKGSSLVFKAGRGAFESIRRDGFSADRIGTIAGASGGAKWLVLSQLDRVILRDLLPKLRGPVHLIGSSIGAWRFACYGQRNPLAAIERLELAYLEQQYSEKPDKYEISEKSREILDFVMRDTGVGHVLESPLFRTHFMAVRARHLTAAEHPAVLGAGLAAAAALNVASRRSLGAFFERALFYDDRDIPPFFEARGFPMQKIPLTADNFKDAVIASGSIPMILEGVKDIAGASPGVYRDGGIIDYHLDLPQSQPDRLTLYPHFYEQIVPGWFDKKLSWRTPDPVNIDRTVLVSPSREFVESLPNAKIPDRNDFVKFDTLKRKRDWRTVILACQRLAEEFHEVLEKDRLAARLQPL
ncbi:MAG: patatin-like phospholipase family protein [Woeseiaceae bacterium]|nr:patatin-like phospholipase family protein [Woeseiaceae bacterium]